MFIKFSDKTKRITVKTSDGKDSSEGLPEDSDEINLNDFNNLNGNSVDNRRIHILKNHIKNDSEVK